MRRGCIALGKVQCDVCHRFLDYGERYLMVDDKEGREQRLCVDCSLSQGYASYKTGKREEEGEGVLTFFLKN